MISLEKHIPPNVRRELCGRLIYFDSVQPLKYKPYCEESSYDPTAVTAIDELRNTLFKQIIQEELAVSNPSGNESFLTRILSRLAEVAEPQLVRHPELLADLRSVLQEKILGISCANCHSSSSELPEEEEVGTTGCCMASLRQMFNTASETSTKYYSEFTSVRPCNLPAVIFCTQHVRDSSHLHELSVAYAITGSTEMCVQSQQYWSEVRLKMCVPEFDFDSYMAVPYVLLHECIIHTFQDILPSCEKRDASEPDDGFMEGWMDYVTFKIMQEIIAGRGPVGHFGRSGVINEEHGARASSLHSSRINLEATPSCKSSQYACYRRAGTDVADKVLHVLERLPKSRYDPWRAFLQMSLNLNLVQSFTPFHRKKFVGILNNLAKRGKLESERQIDIVSIINHYLEHLDVTRLVEEIFKLTAVWGQRRSNTGPLSPLAASLIGKPKPREIH